MNECELWVCTNLVDLGLGIWWYSRAVKRHRQYKSPHGPPLHPNQAQSMCVSPART